MVRNSRRRRIDRAALVGNSFGGAVALSVAVVAPERVAALSLVSAPPPDFEPSAELVAAWEAEQSALQRGDIEAAVAAVLDAWMLADAPAALRDRVAAMQRRAFEVQAAAGAVTEAQDPVEAHPEALGTLEIPARRGTRFEPRLGLPAGAPAVVQRLLVCFSSVVAWLHGHLRC